MSHVLIVTPASPGSQRGNRVTAERYGRLLAAENHSVEITQKYAGQRCDVLIGLHARRSAPSIAAYREERPRGPLVVVLAGTDLYRDLPAGDAEALRSLELADRLIVLHPRGADDLPEGVRAKSRAVVQSVEPLESLPDKPRGTFQVCVLGHLRAVKDPLRAAKATRLLGEESKLRLVQIGAAIDPDAEERARAEQSVNPRYRWLGELAHAAAMEILAGSHLHVLTSTMEGGANALCEAIAYGVPSLSTRIAGSVGILGSDYPGFFPVGATEELAGLLRRAELDSSFLQGLRHRCAELLDLVAPARERAALSALVEELCP